LMANLEINLSLSRIKTLVKSKEVDYEN